MMLVVDAKTRTQRRIVSYGRRIIPIANTAVTLIFGSVAAINLWAVAFGTTSLPKAQLAAVGLSLYLLAEARHYLRRTDNFGVMSPAFMALIFHFFLSYLLGITAKAFYPHIMDGFTEWLADIDGAIAETLLLALFAAFFMLRGYGLGRHTANRLRVWLERSPQIRETFLPVLWLVVVIQFGYLCLVAYSIDLGIYGLLSTTETREQHAGLTQLVNLALAAGTLSYFLILLSYFKLRANGRASGFHSLLVTIMVGLHVFAGALSGFKAQVFFPFVIVTLAYFVATGRFSLLFICVSVAAFITSYTLIEPYRTSLGTLNEPPRSIGEAVETIWTAQRLQSQSQTISDLSFGEQVTLRTDLSGVTAVTVNFTKSGALTVATRKTFQESIVLSPLIAYIPRAIWPDKPSYSEGVWFNQVVRGRFSDASTSVGMGPIGYLYIAGGWAVVGFGFWSYGIVQALIFEGFGRARAGGLIIFLSVASTLYTIPSSFGPAVGGILQRLPAAFLAQFLFLRPRPNISETSDNLGNR